MTDEHTITLGDALERLNSELDQLAEQAANNTLDDGAQPAAVEAQRNGVQYLVDEYGADAEVTIRAVRTGLFGEVEDRVNDARAQRLKQGSDRQSTDGITRVFYVAQGCVGAPFYDEFARDLDDRVTAVRSLPIEAAKWLEAEIDDVTTVDPGNSKSFADLYRAKTSESAAGETSATPPESS